MTRYSKEEIYQELMGNLAGTHKYMVKQLLSDNEEMEKALEFYANCSVEYENGKEGFAQDGGAIAQEALAKLNQVKGEGE